MTSGDKNSSVKKEKSLGEVELKPLFSSDGNESISSFEGIDSDDHHHASHGGGHGHEFGVGTASPRQVVINIFISFVGSGMLGMPYAFSRSGWVLGILCLGVISALNVYAMLLLVKTRRNLESKGHTDIEGYGDIGRVISGTNGERFVNICLVISQLGFATAYIIFIAANINNIAGIPRAYICFGCVPILSVLVQLQDMKHLSPFSLIADVANLAGEYFRAFFSISIFSSFMYSTFAVNNVGLTAVLCQDWEAYHDYHEPVMKFNWSNMLYVSAVALYSLEGVGMVLPLESSCENRDWFPSLLKKTLFAITSLMAVFGCCGYFAFGSVTAAPITLNLDGNVSTIVKLALCLGLYLTYPIMMFPGKSLEQLTFLFETCFVYLISICFMSMIVNEVIEDIVLGEGSRQNKGFRVCVVLFSAFVAWSIPDFGVSANGRLYLSCLFC